MKENSTCTPLASKVIAKGMLLAHYLSHSLSLSLSLSFSLSLNSFSPRKWHHLSHSPCINRRYCVCVCVCARARACVRVCVWDSLV